MLTVYITSHGFGHATRTAEVLRVLRLMDGRVPISVVSTAPERLFAVIPGGVQRRAASVDFGLAQRDALNIDEPGTAARWRVFAETWDVRVMTEVEFIERQKTRLVLGDIPPIAFEAAHRAGVPAIALGNFSWDWIYAHYADREPILGEAARTCAAAQARTDLLLQLPFSGGMTSFPVREGIPLIARRGSLARAESRRRLGLDSNRPIVLLSFGGIGLDAVDPATLGREADLQFMIEAAGPTPPNVLALSDDLRAAKGLQYEDVVSAADVVATKAGYGIVTDTIASGARLLYTDRGDFPEYPIMVDEMPRYAACRHIPREDLFGGRITPHVRALMEQPSPSPPDLSGAEVTARRLLERLNRR